MTTRRTRSLTAASLATALLLSLLVPLAAAAPPCDRGHRTCEEPTEPTPPDEPQETCISHPWFTIDWGIFYGRLPRVLLSSQTTCVPVVLP